MFGVEERWGCKKENPEVRGWFRMICLSLVPTFIIYINPLFINYEPKLGLGKE
jgi:hypothetical protein